MQPNVRPYRFSVIYLFIFCCKLWEAQGKVERPHSLPPSLIHPVSVAPFVNLQESGSAEGAAAVGGEEEGQKDVAQGQTAGLVMSELILAE